VTIHLRDLPGVKGASRS